MSEAKISGAEAGALAGAVAGQRAAAEAAEAAATKAATEVATKTLKEALETLGKLHKPVQCLCFLQSVFTTTKTTSFNIFKSVFLCCSQSYRPKLVKRWITLSTV